MKNRVIAAVKDENAMQRACRSNVSMIFDLAPKIDELEKRIELCKASGKILFIHIDMAEGLGKDKAGLKYAKEKGVAGIISTRSTLIKQAKESGLKSVQRMFILDSQSLETGIEMIKIKPDMIEIMPGVISSKVIKRVCSKTNLPVIAGGLIETPEEVEAALRAGAVAVSTGKEKLW